MDRGSAGCAGEGHPHADLQTGRGRLSGPSTGSLPAARGSLFRVRASIVPATAELCAVAAHRDVFKAVRGKERASRSEDRSCGEWLVAVVEIGRASCRERVEIWGGAGGVRNERGGVWTEG